MRPWASEAGRQCLHEFADGSSWPRRADGHPAVDRVSLDAVIRGQDGGDLKDLASIIGNLQAPPTFLKDIAKRARGQRVHPVYTADTATGRWRSVHPNILGAGRRSAALLAQREVILAEPGEVFIGVDLAGIDARCVAGLAGDTVYVDMVTGADPHGTMAQLFLGDADQRMAAKAITHGINYGRGARSLADQTGKSISEVESPIRGYSDAYPGVARWQDEMRATAASQGRVPTGTGRHVAVDPTRAHTTAPARAAQGAATDLAVVGLLRLEAAGLLPQVRLFLHDEVVLSVPREQAQGRMAQVAAQMSFKWCSPSGLVIPIVAKPHAQTGPRWSDLYCI